MIRTLLVGGALCACGSNPPATSTFDSGVPVAPIVDATPGPADDLDAAQSSGPTCTPGSVRVVATTNVFVEDGPHLDDGFLYWTAGDADVDASQGYWWGTQEVHRADKLGAAASRLFALDAHGYATSLFAVDSTSAYWIEAPTAFGSLMRGAKDGTTAVALMSGLPNLRALVRAGGTLFFTSGSTLTSIDADGANERIIAANWNSTELVVGATHVYGIVNGSPVRLSRSGGPAEPLLLEPTLGIAYEGLSVGSDGYVHAIAKTEPKGWVESVRLARIPTDRGTPLFGPVIEQNLPSSVRFFTATDGDCVVYTTTTGVMRSCGVPYAIGPGHAESVPVVDSTSVYWRATSHDGTTTFYAACKL